MATIVNARDIILQADSPRVLPVSLASNITSIPNTVTVTGYSTLGQMATDSSNALSQVGSKLNKASADVLSGTISVATAGGFKAGTIVWDSVGNVTSGSGVAMTAKGIVGASGGSPTFSIDVNGNAYYYGTVSANQITSGSISASTISVTSSGGFKAGTIAWDSSGNLLSGSGMAMTAKGLIGAASGVPTFSIDTNGNAKFSGTINTVGDATFYGRTTSGINIKLDGDNRVVDFCVSGWATSNPVNSSYVRNGLFGYSNTPSAYANIGVIGYGAGTKGIGILGQGSWGGGYFYSDFGYAIACKSIGGDALQVFGSMTIDNSKLVTNLNADQHDGYHAGNSSGQIPVSNGTTCTNLNADMLDGNHSSAFATSGHTHSIYPSQFVTQSGTGNISAGTVYFYTSTGLTAYQFFSDGGGSVGMRSVSDINLKQDIVPEDLDISFIRKLNPVSYRMKSDTSVKHHGFIAQDVEPLLPDSPDSLKMQYKDGVKGMDYIALIAPIVKAIQQIDERLIKIEEKLNA